MKTIAAKAKTTWSDMSVIAKAITTIVPAIILVVGLASAIQTDAEASEYREHHEQDHICRQVADLEYKIDEYEYRQLFGDGVSENEHEWLDRKIEELKDQIKRLDPNGYCL